MSTLEGAYHCNGSCGIYFFNDSNISQLGIPFSNDICSASHFDVVISDEFDDISKNESIQFYLKGE